MDFNIGNFIIGMAFGPAAVLICPFVVVPWLVVLHLAVRKRNPLSIVDVCALVVCVVVWSLGFVVRVLWSLRFESGKLLLGILNGLLPLVWLSVSVC